MLMLKLTFQKQFPPASWDQDSKSLVKAERGRCFSGLEAIVVMMPFSTDALTFPPAMATHDADLSIAEPEKLRKATADFRSPRCELLRASSLLCFPEHCNS